MIICKHCGEEIGEKHIICPYCAKKQTDPVKNKKIKSKTNKESVLESSIKSDEELISQNEDSVIVEEIYTDPINKEEIKKDEVVKESWFKLEYVIYILSAISIICLFFPIVEFNYYPKENSLYDLGHFLNNNIDLRHKLNIFRLIFGYKLGNETNVFDTIKFNPINILLIALPILVSIFKNKKFSIAFIIVDIAVLICTRFLFLDKGMTGFEKGFGYEIIYSFGFFVNFVVLIIFLIFDFYYLFGSEKKNGNDM